MLASAVVGITQINEGLDHGRAWRQLLFSPFGEGDRVMNEFVVLGRVLALPIFVKIAIVLADRP
jgi:hypothetical protein